MICWSSIFADGQKRRKAEKIGNVDPSSGGIYHVSSNRDVGNTNVNLSGYQIEAQQVPVPPSHWVLYTSSRSCTSRSRSRRFRFWFSEESFSLSLSHDIWAPCPVAAAAAVAAPLNSQADTERNSYLLLWDDLKNKFGLLLLSKRLALKLFDLTTSSVKIINYKDENKVF